MIDDRNYLLNEYRYYPQDHHHHPDHNLIHIYTNDFNLNSPFMSSYRISLSFSGSLTEGKIRFFPITQWENIKVRSLSVFTGVQRMMWFYHFVPLLYMTMKRNNLFFLYFINKILVFIILKSSNSCRIDSRASQRSKMFTPFRKYLTSYFGTLSKNKYSIIHIGIRKYAKKILKPIVTTLIVQNQRHVEQVFLEFSS